MMERNSLEPSDLVSVIFTATPDLRSAFPAAAARRMGLTDVPLLCAAEIDVEGALGRVVRVLMHVQADANTPVTHIYLDGAESLRDDP
jgi:chorismate mutase